MVGGSSSKDSDVSKSIRKRFTTTIKRALSIGKPKESKEAKPIASASAAAAAPTPTPVSAPAPSTPPQASSSATAPAVSSPLAPKAPIKTETPPTAAPKIESKSVEKPAARPTRPPRFPTSPPPVLSAAERAQALFKKHGLEISPSDWPLSTTVQGERVQKEIRMRVHRTCHKCSTGFGSEKVCIKCEHKRCKKCPRHPIKRTKDNGKGPEKVGHKKKKDFAAGLTMPSRTGGQDLVRKKIRMRVHRECHRCNTDFAGQKKCHNCGHTRCKTCPRYPQKNKPPGYYDDYDPSASEEEPIFPPPPRRTYKKPRRRIHWVCKECNTTFLEKTRECEGCGNRRDVTGVRDPPKKQPPKPTEEDIKRLEERLKMSSLSA